MLECLPAGLNLAASARQQNITFNEIGAGNIALQVKANF